EVYRFRAGAEGTMSDLDRITDLKHLRVRGMAQVRLSAVLKATGLNILRATAFRNRSRRPKNENEGSMPSLKALIAAVKEQFERLLNVLHVKSDLCLPTQLQIGRLMPQAD
ncbi:MAG: transposase, partial [Desulfuromonadales bacterium]|nr:transposase [Desulfuromonadales bacterium]